MLTKCTNVNMLTKCKNEQKLICLQNVKSMVYNMCRNSYVNCKNVLQEFILVFRDMFLCLVWLFTSPWMNTFQIVNIKIHIPYCAFLKLLTFRGSCIVIYSYNKSQRDALFLKFILIKDFTCFGQIYYPSSGASTLYTRQLVFVMQLC